MSFEQKLIYLIQFTKSPVRPANSKFFPSAKTYNASCRVFEWTLVMRKRSQNHFRLHFTSKTPYSLDTRGILSTPVCDVHWRLKITTSKAIRKDQIDILTNKQDKKYYSTKHLKGLQFFYLRRRVLRVKCLWISRWVTSKTLQI